jgi:dolichol-phosphate mannosyltransferase
LRKSSAHLIVIPAYNEEETIEEVVLRAKKYADICIVDDCSQDRTAEILSTINDIHVIRHEKNTHIPGGLLDGMRYAVKKGYDYIIAMDAGLSHDPDEIPKFIDHPHSDLAIGSRITKINTPLFRKTLSKAGNLIYNCCLEFPASLFKQRYYTDITSGYRRYSNEAMKLLLSKKMESQSFDILFESAMFIYRNRLSISEVPITYAFTNSSLNPNIVKDCMKMCLRSVIKPRT